MKKKLAPPGFPEADRACRGRRRTFALGPVATDTLPHSPQPRPLRASAPNTAPRPHFPTADPAWATTWDAALAVLAGNVRSMPRYDHPVLVEGSTYAGIWLECAPQEGQVYGTLQKYVATPAGQPTPLETARANHMAFFAQQKADGQLSASIKLADKVGTSAGYGQIQMVVPIAATAWDIFQLTIPTTRNSSKPPTNPAPAGTPGSASTATPARPASSKASAPTTPAMDNSPRWKGVRNQCPGADARVCPPDPGVPRLCPDLSATVYGGRIALAAMAHALGKPDDQARWLADAEHIRQLILTKLYSPEDAAFYDLDTQNNFVKVRSVVIIRVLGEHVVDPHKDKHIFEAIWTKQVHNPKAFWAPYPARHPSPWTSPPSSAPSPATPGAEPARPSPPSARPAGWPTTASRPSSPTSCSSGAPPSCATPGRQRPAPSWSSFPPADGPAHRRLHPERPRRLLPLRPHLPRLRPPPQQRLANAGDHTLHPSFWPTARISVVAFRTRTTLLNTTPSCTSE